MDLNKIRQNRELLNGTIRAIKIEQKKLEAKKEELQDYNQTVNKQLAKQYEQLSIYSTFDIDIIGKAIATLLTKTEGIPYTYGTFMLTAREIVGYDYGTARPITDDTHMPIKMIIQEKFSSILGDSFKLKALQDYLSENAPTIVFDRALYVAPKTQINLYDWDLDLDLNNPYDSVRLNRGITPLWFEMPPIEEEHHDTIFGFVNYLVGYRLENDKQEISEEEINTLLDDYIVSITNQEENNPQNHGVKTIGTL